MVMQQQLTSAPLASAFATRHTHRPASGSRRACRDLPSKSAGVEALRHARSFTQGKRVSTAVSSSTALVQEEASSQVVTERDRSGRQRLKLQDKGWNWWKWRGNKIHYIKAGSSGTPVLLVHGFGASAYHWRYVLPELAKKHTVYAIDLLGFGWSSKPSVVYDGYTIWSDQLSDFVKQVMGGGPVTLVGNSLGAYASLLTCAYHPELSKGLVLVNGAGRFEEVKAAVEANAEAGLQSDFAKKAVQEAAGVRSEMPARSTSSSVQSAAQLEASSTGKSQQNSNLLDSILEPLQVMAKRTAIYVAFLAAKQPGRIRQVLRQVYVSEDNIDDELVRSIVRPAQDSNAPDVFYRVISSTGESLPSLLRKLKVPLLLLWGELDPWITPASADKIQKLYPAAERINIRGGHCPHDDVPQLFNPQLSRWLDTI